MHRSPELSRPFAALRAELRREDELRQRITAAYRRPEPECAPPLIAAAKVATPIKSKADSVARRLIAALRSKQGDDSVESLIHEYALSSDEGVALMCLAEALLRIPDAATRDALIRDKIGEGDWQSHLGHSRSIFVNAATWGLIVARRLVATTDERRLSAALMRLLAKGGEPLIRKAVDLTMRMIGDQFVFAETIEDAMVRSAEMEARGFCYSYDMLGEAAVSGRGRRAIFRGLRTRDQGDRRERQSLGAVSRPGHFNKTVRPSPALFAISTRARHQ